MGKKKKELTEEEITERISKIYKEVRKQSKSKKKEEDKDKPTLKQRPKSSQKEKRRERKSSKGQKTLTGPTVTIKEMAFDHNISPRELRRILRKSNISKPGGRWEWEKDSEEVEKIVKLIKS